MTYAVQDDILLNNLVSYYKSTDNLDVILPILNGKSKISLRIIDWFTTNYAKKYGTVIVKNDKRINIYNDYKLNLKSFSKKRFDSFCRAKKVDIQYKDDSYIRTTVGQMNFFRWTVDNGIIEYINDNYDKIEKDMNARNSTSKKKLANPSPSSTSIKTRKKREELSVASSKGIRKENINITVSFNNK